MHPIPSNMFFLASPRTSGVRAFIALRYIITKIFGTNFIMFCSPQPVGHLINRVSPLIVGPIMSPKSKRKTLDIANKENCCIKTERNKT